MVQLIKGREPLLEMGLPQIFAQAIALGYQKAQQEQQTQQINEAMISRILMQEELRRQQEATKPTKIDYYDPGDILTQARGQYSMYAPLDEYGETVRGLTGAGYRMGTMKQPGLPTLGTTRDIKRGTQVVQQEYADQGWQDIGGWPRFKPSQPTTKMALDMLPKIAKQKATLEKTDIATAFLVAFNPDLKVGQKLTDQDKQRLFQAWNNQIEYYNQFVPEKSRMKPFTIGPEKTIAALPEGLTEEDIEYNMKKYGKTRQEVIDAYMKFKGLK